MKSLRCNVTDRHGNKKLFEFKTQRWRHHNNNNNNSNNNNSNNNNNNNSNNNNNNNNNNSNNNKQHDKGDKPQSREPNTDRRSSG
ncbi:hypothetical protein INR49_008910 [Caranx melampygus]|nr:hypothetical protein INR49_008910 [Caranx melampygus]